MFTNKRWQIFLLVLMISISSYSQYKRPPKHRFDEGLTLSGKVGANIFFGDLVDKSRTNFTLGLTLDREMHKLFTVRTSLMGGKMSGAQILQGQQDPKIIFASFDNTYFEWTIGGTYSILNHIYGYFRERRVQPYFLMQLGLLYYNATEYVGLEDYIQDPHFGSEGSNVWRIQSGLTLTAGMGIGTTYWINPKWKASLEINGFYPFTDKLDAHDYWYMKSDIKEDGITLHPTKSNDFYYTATFNPSKFRNSFSYNRKSFEQTRKFFPQKVKKIFS